MNAETKLNKDTPRLSGLFGNSNRHRCAHCGTDRDVHRWQEHDHHDRPEAKVVALCGRCSNFMIEAHARLYRKLAKTEFVPGSAEVCVDCPHRALLSCTCPAALFNGGAVGLEYEPAPTVAHINAGRASRWVAFEHEPVVRCSGKAVLK